MTAECTELVQRLINVTSQSIFGGGNSKTILYRFDFKRRLQGFFSFKNIRR